MKKKLGLSIIGLSLIVVLSYLALAWWCARHLEDTQLYRTLLRQQPYVKLVKTEYHPGLLSSSAITTLTLTEFGKTIYGDILKPKRLKAADFQIQLSETIQHGPLLRNSTGDWVWGRSSSETQVLWPLPLKNLLQQAYGTQNALQLKTLVKLNGDATLYLSNAAFKHPVRLSTHTLRWGGVQGQIAYSEQNNRMRYQWKQPNFSTLSTTGLISTAKNIRINGDYQRIFGEFLMGNTEASAEQVAFIQKNSQQNSQQNPASQSAIAQINQLQYQHRLQKNGEFIDIKTKSKMASIEVGNQALGPLQIDLGVKHLHGPTLVKFLSTLNEIQGMTTSAPQKQELIQGALLQYVVPLLKRAPSFFIEHLRFGPPEKEVRLQARASFENFTGAELQQPMALIGKLALSLTISIPKEFLFLAQQNQAKPPEPERLIENLLKARALIRVGERLESQICLRNGRLEVNGSTETANAMISAFREDGRR